MSEPTDIQRAAMYELGFRQRDNGTWHRRGYDYKTGAHALRRARSFASAMAKRLADPLPDQEARAGREGRG